MAPQHQLCHHQPAPRTSQKPQRGRRADFGQSKTPTFLINKGKQGPCALAVTVGFEPTLGSHLNNISSVAPSAARTRHQRVNLTGSRPNIKNELPGGREVRVEEGQRFVTRAACSSQHQSGNEPCPGQYDLPTLSVGHQKSPSATPRIRSRARRETLQPSDLADVRARRQRLILQRQPSRPTLQKRRGEPLPAR